jgi:hypothetical protein
MRHGTIARTQVEPGDEVGSALTSAAVLVSADQIFSARKVISSRALATRAIGHAVARGLRLQVSRRAHMSMLEIWVARNLARRNARRLQLIALRARIAARPAN